MGLITDEGYDLDIEMLAILPFGWGSATSLGLVESDIIGAINAADVVWSSGGVELTIGRIVALAALFGVLIHRDASLKKTKGIDLWMVYATIGLLIAPPLFPAFENTLAQQPAALISFTVQSTGFLLVSYIN